MAEEQLFIIEDDDTPEIQLMIFPEAATGYGAMLTKITNDAVDGRVEIVTETRSAGDIESDPRSVALEREDYVKFLDDYNIRNEANEFGKVIPVIPPKP